MGMASSREVTFTHFFKPNETRPGQVRFHDVSALFITTSQVPLQGEAAVRQFRAMKCTLQLSKTLSSACRMPLLCAVDDVTVNRLYSVFVDMDRDGAGSIDLQEMIRYLQLEETPFTDRVFHLFGAHILEQLN